MNHLRLVHFPYLGQREFKSLLQEVRSTRLHAFAKGTYSNLRTQFRSYFGFCVYFQRTPLPAHIDTMCCYAQFLSRVMKPPSIRNYLSGVKMLHIFLGYEYTISDDFHMHLTIRGIERIIQHVPQRAKPITPAILQAIHSLSFSFSSLERSVFACGLFLFFTMARAGSILPTSHHTPTHQFLTRDRVNYSREGILVTLLHTKTIQTGKRRLHIPLPSTGSVLCPVKAYSASIATVPRRHFTPAFVYFADDKVQWLTTSTFTDTFRRLLARASIDDATAYTGHSFRRGGASWAFQSGVPGELIQICGDWASDAYKTYLEFNTQNKLDLAALMFKDLP